MDADTCAFVGAAGGVGTTRLTIECATLLAGEGRDVAILDAAYGTQGLADRTPGRIDPDLTALCLGDDPLSEGLTDLDISGAGRLAVCPARAPFERLARAKTPEAAEALTDRIAEAARAFEFVLVDVAPIAANQAVAAVTSVDHVAAVCDAERADAAIPRTEDRLADVGAATPVTVLTRTEAHADADVSVPTFESAWPAIRENDDAYDAVAATVQAILDVEITRQEEGGLLSKFPV